MIIGTPKEIKANETRVGMTPKWAKILTDAGHCVLMQKEAGLGSNFSDEEYINAGARIVSSIDDIYQRSDLVAKVKEIKPYEFNLMKKDQMVMAWFHLAEDYDQKMTQALLDCQAIGLSMELIVLNDGSRPTIKPMSDIAGSLATLEATKYSQKINGGSGLLLRKIYGLPSPKIVILGGGNAGINAAQVAIGLGLSVSIIEASWARIDYLKLALPTTEVVFWDKAIMDELLSSCDVLINCIYPAPGKREPVIKRESIKRMKKDAIIIDIAGAGIIETSHYTTLEDPIFFEEGHMHYCVDNMPALCPKTSTESLLMITGPYLLSIADKGLKQAAREQAPLLRSISTFRGEIVHPEIGINQGMPYKNFELDMLDILE